MRLNFLNGNSTVVSLRLLAFKENSPVVITRFVHNGSVIKIYVVLCMLCYLGVAVTIFCVLQSLFAGSVDVFVHNKQRCTRDNRMCTAHI